MVYNKIILSLFAFLQLTVISFFGQTQDPVIKKLSEDYGISQSTVNCFIQDTYGFIWMGSENGLIRFDGNDIRLYKYSSSDSNSINSNNIFSLYVDHKGDLWIGSPGGLNLYDKVNDRFISKSHWPKRNVYSITEDGLNNLWIPTGDQLFKYNLSSDSIIGLKGTHPDLLSGSDGFKIVYRDKDHNIWCGTSFSGLLLYNQEMDTFIKYVNEKDIPESISKGEVNTIFNDSYGGLWIGTSSGLDLFINASGFPEKGIFSHYSNEIDPGFYSDVICLAEDNDHNLYIGTETSGINVINLNEYKSNILKTRHYYHDPVNQYSLNSNSIKALYRDNQNNLWIGTSRKGVNIIHPNVEKIKAFQINTLNGLFNNIHVNTFCEDGNYIWIGTEEGLTRYSKKNKTFKSFVHDDAANGSISSNIINSIIKDKEGNIWVGTWAGGLNMYNRKTETFTRYLNNPGDPNSLSSNNISSILETGNGNFWIATMGGGLNLFNSKNKIFKHYDQLSSNISGNYITALAETSDNDIWIANGGPKGQFLELFDFKTGLFRQFLIKSIDLTDCKVVYSIFIDSKKQIWLGTDKGLLLFDQDPSKIKWFRTEDGLADNAIKSITEDESGNLWLASNKGLTKFVAAVHRQENIIFRNYSVSDGLHSDEFKARSCLRDSRGYLYFGGVNGFEFFHPDSLNDTSILNLLITDFLIFNKPVSVGTKGSPLKQNITLTKDIKLKYRQSVISFKFAALNFINPEKNQYAYKMEGFEDNWNYVGNKREATYTNLNPGKYIFHVKAANKDGIWNKKIITLNIEILPPWWKTLIFRISAVLLLFSTGIGLYMFRVRNYKKRQIYLENLVKERTREIEEKNIKLIKQAEELNEVNTVLEERQQFIEEQTEEIRLNNEYLQMANEQSLAKQEMIHMQSEILEETNQKLVQLNATKDKLFSIIAHDLKNPFGSILNFSEILHKKYNTLSEDKKAKFIKVIYESSLNVYELLNNLFQWARTQTGNIKHDPQAFDIEEVIDDNFELIKNVLEEKQINFVKSICVNGTKIFADRNMISTIIRNLIGNAVKYTQGGTIAVNVSRNGSVAEISISDSGIGIPENKINGIFEIDQEKSTPGTKGEKGSGLGLLICKEFVAINGGEIKVTSEKGKGTSFIFTVPLQN